MFIAALYAHQSIFRLNWSVVLAVAISITNVCAVLHPYALRSFSPRSLNTLEANQLFTTEYVVPLNTHRLSLPFIQYILSHTFTNCILLLLAINAPVVIGTIVPVSVSVISFSVADWLCLTTILSLAGTSLR